MDVQDGDLFRSFFLGGFECSTHRRLDGRRLDILAATGHDHHAEANYRLLAAAGIRAVRDGIRWHRIEVGPGWYDWSSVLPQLRAARAAGVQVIWDLCHYGWPDDLDIWSPAFVDRFAGFAAAAARLIRSESDAIPFFCPINEISFLAWAGGDEGYMNPFARGEGERLKVQLVRAAIAAVDAIRAVDHRARFVYAEPAIHVTAAAPLAEEHEAAERRRLSQFQTYDMLSGREEPGLGGAPAYLDIVGVNFYPHNQWYQGGSTIPLGHHGYRPLHQILAEFHARYGRPLLIAETGAEGSARPSWLHYVCAEVRQACANGVPVRGICLYPVLDYPGWDDERPCEVGLLTARGPAGTGRIHQPLMDELTVQRHLMDREGSRERAFVPAVARDGALAGGVRHG